MTVFGELFAKSFERAHNAIYLGLPSVGNDQNTKWLGEIDFGNYDFAPGNPLSDSLQKRSAFRRLLVLWFVVAVVLLRFCSIS